MGSRRAQTRGPWSPGTPLTPRPPRKPRGPVPPLLLPLLALAAGGTCAAPAPRAEDLSLGVGTVVSGHRPALTLDHGRRGDAFAFPLYTLEEWLSRFGYLPPLDTASGQPRTREELGRAVAAMQRFAGLEATGELDEATLALMRTPRCSLPDPLGLDDAPTRRRRQVAPARWHKRNLSWRVRAFPRDSSLGRDTVRALLHYALRAWSDAAPLDFHEVAGGTADLQVDFTRGAHGDRFPFDGPGGGLAHAFPPGAAQAGAAHFDAEEAWTFRSGDERGVDLFTVAVHEFGHALGLGHSAAGSIMQPYYRGPAGDPLRFGLAHQDRVRLWQLYGVRESVSTTALPEPEESPRLPEPPDNRSSTPPGTDTPHRCQARFDAVAQIRGEAFFFTGRHFWRLTRDRQLVSPRPAQLQRFWRGLPRQLDGVDAVYERPSDHKIIFFRGDRYWVFRDTSVEDGYPRPVSDFGLPPGGVDAAFSRAPGGKTYFFKDQLFWCFDESTRSLEPGHPARSPPWRGIPSTLDAAMRWSDGASYFFRGREYWKVPEDGLEAEPGYPQPTARDWLLCGDPQEPRDPAHPEDAYQVCSCSSGAPLRPLSAAALPLCLLWWARARLWDPAE